MRSKKLQDPEIPRGVWSYKFAC